MLITSVNNQYIKDIIKLKDKKYRDKLNKFIVEGEHLALEAYKKGLLEQLILEENTSFSLDVKTTYVTSNVIKKISSLDNYSSIIGIAHKKFEDKLGDKLLILDNIQDPGNLGTIIRSANAFDIDTIILSNTSVDLYNPKVIRATQGMLFHINIIVRDLEKLIPELKEDGYEIVGTKVNGGNDIKKTKLNNRFALIMGNEGQGIENKILNMCDEYLFIKTNESVESLNVAVATSILLYEIYNK